MHRRSGNLMRAILPTMAAAMFFSVATGSATPAIAHGATVESKSQNRGAAQPTELRHGKTFQVRMLVTGYCPCSICCGPGAHGVTASGLSVGSNGGHFVAADPRVAFGTMLQVPGYNEGRPVPVLDRGGAIKGRRLDVFFPTHQAAKKWGARWLTVTILQK